VKRFSTFAVLFAVVVFGCSSDRPGRRALPDGSYQLSCEKPLADCLAILTDVCKDHGYDVISAKEMKKRYGVEPASLQREVTTSDAIVRCRSANALLLSDSAPSSSSAHAAAAPSRCFPGSTVACLGPGACKGAQTCQQDGATLGPCDCGGGTVAPVPPVSNEAGPPPTWAVPDADAGTQAQ
jgi:hypothetical protein